MVDDARQCHFATCERKRVTREWCQAHYRQWQKWGETFELGDLSRRSALIKASWERMTDEERAARIAPMISATKGRVRSETHRARLSESIRAAYAKGEVEIKERVCRGCEEPFQPNSNHHFWCDEDCQKARGRLRRHGLSNREYLDIAEAQGGNCALCGSKGRGYGGSRYALVIDHCHDTGKVRGLLCPDCNTALGRFGDDADRLRKAADYIERTCPH
jgi:RNase P subunit RPR2